MQENQKTESFKLVLNLPTGKNFFLPTYISSTDGFEAAEWTEKLNVENVRFDVLKEATHFVVKVFGNRFTVEEFLEEYTFGFNINYLCYLFSHCRSYS